MPDRALVLHVFSGTGNTFRVAEWIRARFAAACVAADVRFIGRGSAPISSSDMLALCTPTHGFTAPWPAIRHALGLPFGRGAQAFVVGTRGATLVGKLYVPGLEGTALYLLALILFLKGYHVRGAAAFDMPLNWTAAVPGPAPEATALILRRAQPVVEAFADRMLGGQRAFHGFVQFVIGLLLAPISLAYLVAGRFWLAKLFFATHRCTHCGLCAQMCPAHAIVMRNVLATPYWTFRCVSCMRCMNYCPAQAIEAAQAWAVPLAAATMAPIPALALGWCLRHGLPSAIAGAWWAWTALHLLWLFAALVVMDGVFRLLLRIPACSRLFAWLTFTRRYRRYHEPATGPAQLK